MRTRRLVSNFLSQGYSQVVHTRSFSRQAALGEGRKVIAKRSRVQGPKSASPAQARPRHPPPGPHDVKSIAAQPASRSSTFSASHVKPSCPYTRQQSSRRLRPKKSFRRDLIMRKKSKSQRSFSDSAWSQPSQQQSSSVANPLR